jgi:hypothetical protein
MRVELIGRLDELISGGELLKSESSIDWIGYHRS